MIEIIHSDSTWPPHPGNYNNKIIIYDDNWNDYCYMTTFHMVYCNMEGKVYIIGDVKIYYYDYDEARTKDYGKAVSSVIDDKIIQLDKDKFCSLGQSLKYYENLKNYLPNDYVEVLSILNDMATNDSIYKRFQNEKGVKISLLRETSANKALNEANLFLEKNRFEDKNISFSCNVTVPYMSDLVTKLDFNFTKDNYLPYRINAIIGKNGTGKTQILSFLADILSGLKSGDDIFVGDRPPIYKVMSISYSAFDSFKRKKIAKEDDLIEENNEIKNDDSLESQNSIGYNEMKSYVYCGIQSEKGTLSLEELKKKFNSAFEEIKKKHRIEDWKKVMKEVIEPEHIQLITKILDNDTETINWSSGQHILICTLTEVIANIERESIILFDEPEIHLHPNAISNTLRMLNIILDNYNSYAILATHSPIIIQEIPSRYIQILERNEDILTVRKPGIECFGENITQITNEVFEVKNTESNYKSYLRSALDTLSFEEVNELFDGKLSFNALLYLKSFDKEKSGE